MDLFPDQRPLIRRSLDRRAAEQLLDEIAAILAEAPLYRATMPRWGTPFSVEMSNCGTLGWVSDKSGYRYQPTHPVTGRPWPAIPASLQEIWFSVTDYRFPPEACLINYYASGAKMGLHQDRDEAGFFRACRLGVARRCGTVPARRIDSRCAGYDPHAAIRGCHDSRRRYPPRLSRHRQDPRRFLRPAGASPEPCFRAAGGSI